jgi:hypothetical protein
VSLEARAASVVLAWAALFAGSCGGAAAGPGKSGGDAAKGSKSPGAEGTEDGEEPEARVSPCADGTCMECGSGLCPKGFYCDEKAPGGPACGWLPECAAAATCGCVEQVLGSQCACSEKAGGVSVSCTGG